jgi:hypothetical protein
VTVRKKNNEKGMLNPCRTHSRKKRELCILMVSQKAKPYFELRKISLIYQGDLFTLKDVNSVIYFAAVAPGD